MSLTTGIQRMKLGNKIVTRVARASWHQGPRDCKIEPLSCAHRNCVNNDKRMSTIAPRSKRFVRGEAVKNWLEFRL